MYFRKCCIVSIEETILKKLKKMLSVSDRIRMEQMRKILKMNEDTFNDNIIEWAVEFGFRIDGDYININFNTIDDFIGRLDNQFKIWEHQETTGNGKVEELVRLESVDDSISQIEDQEIIESTKVNESNDVKIRGVHESVLQKIVTFKGWKHSVNSTLDDMIETYKTIVDRFMDIKYSALRGALNPVDLFNKVKNKVSDLPRKTQANFLDFVYSLPKGEVKEDWKQFVSTTLDNYIQKYETILHTFQNFKQFLLKKASSKEDFINIAKNDISDLPEAAKKVFQSFLDTI